MPYQMPQSNIHAVRAIIAAHLLGSTNGSLASALVFGRGYSPQFS